MLQLTMKANVPLAATLTITALCLFGSGCSGISTHRAAKDGPVHGIRVCMPKAYLFVGAQASKLVVLPDLGNAYDVKPWAFLAKTDLNLKMTDGVPTESGVNLDSTASLALIQKLAELAAAGAGQAVRAVSEQELPGTFGMTPGIYTISDQGMWTKVSP